MSSVYNKFHLLESLFLVSAHFQQSKAVLLYILALNCFYVNVLDLLLLQIFRQHFDNPFIFQLIS